MFLPSPSNVDPRVGLVMGATKTSTGTQVYSCPTLSNRQVTGVIILAGNPTTGDIELANVANASLSVGFSDGSNDRYFQGASQNGVTTSSANQIGGTGSILSIPDANGDAAVVVATVSSFGKGEVTLNYTTANGSAYNLAILMFTGCRCAVGTFIPGTAVTGLGFQPTGGIHISSDNSADLSGARSIFMPHIGGFDSNGDEFQFIRSSLNGKSTQECDSRISDKLQRDRDSSDRTILTSIDSGGFTPTVDAGLWSRDAYYFVFDTFKTKTIIANYTGISSTTVDAGGYRPHAAIVLSGECVNTITRYTSSPEAEFFCAGLAAANQGALAQFCLNHYDQVGVGTTNSYTEYATDRVSIPSNIDITAYNDDTLSIDYSNGGYNSILTIGR